MKVAAKFEELGDDKVLELLAGEEEIVAESDLELPLLELRWEEDEPPVGAAMRAIIYHVS